jgi:hypothetical protein
VSAERVRLDGPALDYIIVNYSQSDVGQQGGAHISPLGAVMGTAHPVCQLSASQTIGFKLLYAFVIVRLNRRDLVWINGSNKSMAAMSGTWLCRKVHHPWLGGPRRLAMYLASEGKAELE